MSNTKAEKVTQEVIIEEPVVAEPVVEETPIKEAPKATEAKSFKKEVKKPLSSGKVILIARDGCVAQDDNGKNYRLYGQQYMAKQIGEVIEIPERFI